MYTAAAYASPSGGAAATPAVAVGTLISIVAVGSGPPGAGVSVTTTTTGGAWVGPTATARVGCANAALPTSDAVEPTAVGVIGVGVRYGSGVGSGGVAVGCDKTGSVATCTTGAAGNIVGWSGSTATSATAARSAGPGVRGWTAQALTRQATQLHWKT